MRRFFIQGGLIAALVVLVGVGFLAWIGSSGGRLTPVPPATPGADGIQDVYVFIGIFASALFLIVTIPLALFIVRFRSPGGDRTLEGAQIRGHTRLELAWTIIPVVIVAVIAAFSAYKVGTIRAAGDPVDLDVKVTASQFYWQYEYPNGVVSIDTLRVPVDQVVRLELHARTSDVVHSWWVPALDGKMDVIPGVVNELKFEPTRTGSFRGKCAELCGIQHAAMLTRVEVVRREEFDSWLEEEGRAQAAEESKLGEEIWNGVCAKCHFAAPEYAPNIAGSPLLGDAQSIREIVRNGRGRMPAVGEFWSDRQVEALTDYLQTIAPGGASGG